MSNKQKETWRKIFSLRYGQQRLENKDTMKLYYFVCYNLTLIVLPDIYTYITIETVFNIYTDFSIKTYATYLINTEHFISKMILL